MASESSSTVVVLACALYCSSCGCLDGYIYFFLVLEVRHEVRSLLGMGGQRIVIPQMFDSIFKSKPNVAYWPSSSSKISLLTVPQVYPLAQPIALYQLVSSFLRNGL